MTISANTSFWLLSGKASTFKTL